MAKIRLHECKSFQANRTGTFGLSLGNRNRISLKLYHDLVGTQADSDVLCNISKHFVSIFHAALGSSCSLTFPSSRTSYGPAVT
jgi:hypothetical protein